ncbi:MAG: hypothetical protein R2795_09675 [Saprospiraceae bacterium]
MAAIHPAARPVNLFFDGAYVGKSNLQTATASDTLVFSLGRDEGLLSSAFAKITTEAADL